MSKIKFDDNILLEKCQLRMNTVTSCSKMTAKYLEELDDLEIQVSAIKATADASAASAQSVQLQCLLLMKELDQKYKSVSYIPNDDEDEQEEKPSKKEIIVALASIVEKVDKPSPTRRRELCEVILKELGNQFEMDIKKRPDVSALIFLATSKDGGDYWKDIY